MGTRRETKKVCKSCIDDNRPNRASTFSGRVRLGANKNKKLEKSFASGVPARTVQINHVSKFRNLERKISS